MVVSGAPLLAAAALPANSRAQLARHRHTQDVVVRIAYPHRNNSMSRRHCQHGPSDPAGPCCAWPPRNRGCCAARIWVS